MTCHIGNSGSSVKVGDNLFGYGILSLLKFLDIGLRGIEILSNLVQLLVESILMHSSVNDSIVYVVTRCVVEIHEVIREIFITNDFLIPMDGLQIFDSLFLAILEFC